MRLLLPLIIALTLGACQPHVASDSKPGGSPAPQARQAVTSAAARELAKVPFTCGETNCPAGVGVFTALTDVGYVTCTGFLAGERTFVTNRHCLPESLKVRGTTCRGKAAVAFLDQAVTRIVDCKTVLDLSAEERSFKSDFAYLELDGPQAGALPLSREGVRDDQALRAWVVTRAEGKNVLTSVACRSVLNSLLNPFGASAFSATSVVVGCDVQPGNAGAPLLNARGEAVGLLQGRALGDTRGLLTRMFKEGAPRVPDKQPAHSNFTNLTCVNNPLNGAGPHPNCAKAGAARADDCGTNELLTDDARERVIARVIEALPRTFRYKVTYDEQRRAVVAEPKCVVNPDQDFDGWARHVHVSKWLREQTIDVTYDGLTKLNAVVETDELWRVKPALNFTVGEGWPQRLVLKYGGLWQRWSGVISRQSQTGDSLNLEVTYPRCTAAQFADGNERGYRAADGRELTPGEWRARLEAAQRTRCAM